MKFSIACASLVLASALQPVAAQSPEVPDMDAIWRTFIQSEVLEFAPGGVDDPVRYDLLVWTGGDLNRLWLKADGEHGTSAGVGESEIQALFGRLVSPFWDAQAGIRLDVHYGNQEVDTRAHLALAMQGLAPYWFELEPAVFVSLEGHVSASLTASYEMLLTQRLIFEPRLEASAAIQEVPEFGIGSGLNDVEVGLRLRYEILREVAPYVGYVWARRIGGTTELARMAGAPVRESSFVAGIRLWY